MKRYLGWMVVLMAAGVSAGPSERRSMLAAVDEAHARGDLHKALVRASFLCNRYPDDVAFHTRYQDIQRSLGHEAQVREEYRRRWIARRSVADICLYARMLEGKAAIRAYKQALAKSPAFFWAQYGIGVAYLRVGETKKARDHLERAQSLEPRQPAPKIRLGQLFERQANPGKALEHYRLAAAVAPKVADPLFHQVFALMALQRLDEAEEVAKDLLGHPAPDAAALGCIAMGAVRAGRGDRVGSVQEFGRAVQHSGRYGAHALTFLGDTLTDLGRFDDARKAYAGALEKDANGLRARMGLGYIDYRKGNFAAADKEFAAAQALAAKGDPRNEAEPLLFRGLVAEDDRRLNNALYFFQKAVKRDGRQPDYHLALASLYERLHRPEKALRAYLTAARLDPSDALSLLQAGLIESDLKRPRTAIKHIEAAIARDKHLLEAYLVAGTLCQDELKRPKDAIKWYRAYLAAGGEDKRVAVWIEDLER